jgi:hypothetical protein
VEVSTNLAAADARWYPHALCAPAGPGASYSRPAASGRYLPCPASESGLWAARGPEQVLGYRHGMPGGSSAARGCSTAELPDLALTVCGLAAVEAWTCQGTDQPDDYGRAA